MDYIEEALNVLHYYSDLKASVPIIDRQIEALKVMSTEDELNCTYQIKQLRKSRKDTVNALDLIDNILWDMSKEPGSKLYGPILRKRFIDNLSKSETLKELGCSAGEYRDLGEVAIKKFAIRYHGIAALCVV